MHYDHNIKEDIDMPGTIAGGRKAAQTNRERHGKDFYERICAIGGSRKVPKGFAFNRELASIAGRTGGRVSRRGVGRRGLVAV